MSGIDFTDASIDRYWMEAEKGVSAILSNMQEGEHWTIDSDDIRDEMIEWASNLTNDKLSHAIDNHTDRFIFILSFMKSKKALYFLGEIEKKLPGAISELLLESVDRISLNEGEDIRGDRIFRDRLISLFRVDLLDRIFSKERTENIKKSISTTCADRGGLYE